MSSLQAITDLLTLAIEHGEFFGAGFGVAEGGQLRLAGSVGATAEIYDLASLTKPLVTGLLLALFQERNLLNFEQPVGQFLPELNTPEKSEIRIWQLLTHCSGFPAWRPFYALAENPETILQTIAQTPCEYPPGTRVIYSDLGFITLGILLEHLSGLPLDQLFQTEIAQPLGLQTAGFCPPHEWQPRIAPTEQGNVHERELLLKIALSQTERERAAAYDGWRILQIQGEVHDGNAYFLHGVAGHAGLFANLEDVFLLASQFLPGSRLLKPSSLEMFSHSYTPGLEEERSITWMLATTPGSSAGDALPPSAFGHTGFTGPSVWIDPNAARVYILLLNRTYPIVNLHPTRRKFHALASQFLESTL